MTNPNVSHTPPRPGSDPRPGRNPGYAEDQAGSPADARQPAIAPRPSPDEAGLAHDPDAQPDPSQGS